MSAIVQRILGSAIPRRGVRPRKDPPASLAAVDPAVPVFLVGDGDLVDTNEEGRAYMAAHGLREGADLTHHLSERFGPLPERPADLGQGEARQITGAMLGGRLEVERIGSTLRYEIAEDPLRAAGGVRMERDALAAMEEELASLRDEAACTRAPIWRMRDGVVTSINPAYDALCASMEAPDRPAPWPPACVFDDTQIGAIGDGGTRRIRLDSLPGGEERWFDVTRTDLPNGDLVLHAAAADEVVRAERTLAGFHQTLAATFAHLRIGLAVFDGDRRLSLFNPALSELTEAPAEDLALRPTLDDLLNRMREARVLPEPPDWHAWRKRLTDLEEGASAGTYLETWDMPSGRTWRVAGRPHPRGAIALLIEDITPEIALTRRFRAELEIGQAVVDSLDEAIAVFSPDGVLTLSNAAYADLFGTDPRTTLGDLTINEACRSWMAVAEPSPIWGDLRDFALPGPDREAWTAAVRLTDGRVADCRARPMPGGGTLVGFSVPERSEGPLTGPVIFEAADLGESIPAE